MPTSFFFQKTIYGEFCQHSLDKYLGVKWNGKERKKFIFHFLLKNEDKIWHRSERNLVFFILDLENRFFFDRSQKYWWKVRNHLTKYIEDSESIWKDQYYLNGVSKKIIVFNQLYKFFNTLSPGYDVITCGTDFENSILFNFTANSLNDFGVWFKILLRNCQNLSTAIIASKSKRITERSWKRHFKYEGCSESQASYSFLLVNKDRRGC